jgi:phosphate:Na+ symporter
MEVDIWRPLAGLGLFLFAMSTIEGALEQISGRTFRHLIRNNTHPPIRGIATGTLTTAVLQSSSLVGLMMLALVGAGVVRMRNALAVIFGANLGTTITGWIVATIGFKLNLEGAALPLIALGGISALVLHNPRHRALARLTLGIGLLLMGLEFMKQAAQDFSALADPDVLADLSAFQYLLFGVVFSALVQSSSAVMMVTLSALNADILTLSDAAAIAIGADLGTTGTIIIGAIGASAGKKRVAAGHFLFNLLTDLMAFTLRVPLLALVLLFNLSDILSLVAFHSLFNLLGIIAFLPFIGRFADFLDSKFQVPETQISRHLEEDVAELPEAALEALELETGHLLERVVCQNLRVFHPQIPLPPGLLPAGSRSPEEVSSELADDFELAYERSKHLEGEILRFAGHLRLGNLDEEQTSEVDRQLDSVRDAIQSSKYLSDLDIQSGYDALEKSDYPSLFRTAQEEFYTQLFDLRREGTNVASTQFDKLAALNERTHERLHNQIYGDIQSSAIGRSEVSSLLNINRLLLNSNQSLISALRGYHPQSSATP